jgi:hypothetical protein
VPALARADQPLTFYSGPPLGERTLTYYMASFRGADQEGMACAGAEVEVDDADEPDSCED